MIKPHRTRKCLTALVSLVALTITVATFSASAAWQPHQHIQFVVPTPASGSLDLTARQMQHIWTQHHFVSASSTIINKAGGGHTVGEDYLHEHTGDPYYIEVDSPALLTSHIVGRGKYTYSDFTPLAVLFSEYMAFAVRADSPVRSGKDLIERLKKDPSSLSIAISSARGGTHHIALGLVLQAAHVDAKDIKTVVFQTSGESTIQLLGGHVDVAVVGVSAIVGQLQAGKVRVLAVSAPKRLGGILASIPTWKEQGYDATFANWRAVIAPKGITADQVAYWDNVLHEVMQTKQFQSDIEKNLWVPEFKNSRDTEAFMKEEYGRLQKTLVFLGMVKQH